MLQSGSDGAALRFGLATNLLAQGKLDEALEHAQVAVDLDPDYSAAWRLLGRIRQQLGDPEGAARAFAAGIAVAAKRGDMQLVKEMRVFLARAQRAADERKEKQDPHA